MLFSKNIADNRGIYLSA